MQRSCLFHVTYHPLGRVARQYMPCADRRATANRYTEYGYDFLDREVLQRRPINASNSALQSVTTTWMDPNGWLRRTIDANGYYQDFGYDAFGSVVKVGDSLLNTLQTNQYAYGIQAFQSRSGRVPSRAACGVSHGLIG